jgi:hypothetical protein
MIPSVLGESGFFLTFSTSRKKRCPPSRTGRGKKLKILKLILKRPTKLKRGTNPSLEISELITYMPKGPTKESLTGIEPVNILNKTFRVRPVSSKRWMQERQAAL